MAEGRVNGTPRHVRTLFERGDGRGPDRRAAAGRFAAARGEAAELAFAALVERHGPMVLRVCRGVLRDAHDAEDAFQATFLVLARKAGSLWVRDSLGPWLHGVALRAASCMQAAASRRRKHEKKAAETAPARDISGGDDLASALDEEIGRLPELYRAPVVLCHLEGLSHDQAARPSAARSDVRSRLARGGSCCAPASPAAAWPPWPQPLRPRPRRSRRSPCRSCWWRRRHGPRSRSRRAPRRPASCRRRSSPWRKERWERCGLPRCSGSPRPRWPAGSWRSAWGRGGTGPLRETGRRPAPGGTFHSRRRRPPPPSGLRTPSSRSRRTAGRSSPKAGGGAILARIPADWGGGGVGYELEPR